MNRPSMEDMDHLYEAAVNKMTHIDTNSCVKILGGEECDIRSMDVVIPTSDEIVTYVNEDHIQVVFKNSERWLITLPTYKKVVASKSECSYFGLDYGSNEPSLTLLTYPTAFQVILKEGKLTNVTRVGRLFAYGKHNYRGVYYHASDGLCIGNIGVALTPIINTLPEGKQMAPLLGALLQRNRNDTLNDSPSCENEFKHSKQPSNNGLFKDEWVDSIIETLKRAAKDSYKNMEVKWN